MFSLMVGPTYLLVHAFGCLVARGSHQRPKKCRWNDCELLRNGRRPVGSSREGTATCLPQSRIFLMQIQMLCFSLINDVSTVPKHL